MGEFSGVFQIELPFDLLAIIFNGLDTQVQFFGNITRFLPLPDQLEHFQLPVAKPLYRGFIDIVLTADLLLEHLLGRMTGQGASELLVMVRGILGTALGNDYAWPGNVRELEQAVRRVLLTRSYEGHHKSPAADLHTDLASGIENGTLDADTLLSGYCALLYEKHRTLEEVSRRAGLDPRTAKKYLLHHASRREGCQTRDRAEVKGD